LFFAQDLIKVLAFANKNVSGMENLIAKNFKNVRVPSQEK
jgi:hypothetical protein